MCIATLHAAAVKFDKQVVELRRYALLFIDAASPLLIMDIFRQPAEVFSIMKMVALQIQISLIHQRLCIRLSNISITPCM